MDKNRAFSSDDDENKNIEKIKKSKSPTPFLDGFGKDLTAMAAAGKLDPVIGREDEIDQTIQILNKRKKNNPILIGESGVGKTHMVCGLIKNFLKNGIIRSSIDREFVTT